MNTTEKPVGTKFCKHCGQLIEENAVFCAECGKQVEEINTPPTPPVNQQPLYQSAPPQYQQPNIIINNTNTNMNHASYGGRMKNKWVAFFLCLFLGFIGVHKFYEGKIGMGLLYFFTGGLFIFGVVIDLIVLLTKPNPYYV